MARRIALLIVVFPPILAILWDAYPTLGDPLWLFYATPLYVLAVDFYLRTGRFTRTVLRQRAGLALLCCLITASVILTHWPLRLSFAYAKPALIRLAVRAITESKLHSRELCTMPEGDGIRRGPDPVYHDSVNERAGLFTVGRIDTPIPTEKGSMLWPIPPNEPKYLSIWLCRSQLPPTLVPPSLGRDKRFIYSPTGYVPFPLKVVVNFGDGWLYVVQE
jgi:hypothetical protein